MPLECTSADDHLLCYKLEMLYPSDCDRLISSVVEVEQPLISFIDKQSRNF
ncbi:hypothetical protein [Nostoc piscinale]|uniref:hypothetical protein n=1 Tax=Nostoc piscinale TaxID=224012 RepID=UPI000AEB3616|nr:hypothetical protein [Nostoc piscinale]